MAAPWILDFLEDGANLGGLGHKRRHVQGLHKDEAAAGSCC